MMNLDVGKTRLTIVLYRISESSLYWHLDPSGKCCLLVDLHRARQTDVICQGISGRKL